MKKLLFLYLLSLLPLGLMAQINIGSRIKNKINQRVNEKVDKAVDDALDAAEGKGKKEKQAEDEQETTQSSAPLSKEEAAKEKLSSFSKFDFVPGEKTLFFDDFKASRLGEFPDYWLTNGMGQTVKLNQYPGQWLQLSKRSRYAPDKAFNLPADYTIEFDMIMQAPEGEGLGYFFIKLVDLTKEEGEEEENPMAAWQYDETKAGLNLNWASSYFQIEDNKTDISNQTNNNVLFEKRGTPVHVAIAVNGTRYRLWIDEKKIYDIPQLLPKNATRTHLFLETELNEEDPEHQLYITNFRIAEGRPDMRKALAAEGRFITRGITFDSGSDQLQPASYGVIREIAQVLQEDVSMRLRIIGHTDSDGTAESNLDLSKRRAHAIKTALINTYQIDASRLETDGKGASQPLDNNSTAEGKANNRRAELIKI